LVLIDWDTALVAGPTQEPPTMPSPGGSSTPWSSAGRPSPRWPG